MIYQGVNAPIVVLSVPTTAGLSLSRGHGLTTVSRDLSEFGGAGRIAGDVKQIGTPDAPVWRRVRLFSRRDGRLVREQWSDPVTGEYAFDWINPALEYTLVGYDHTGVYQGVISDDPVIDRMP